MEQLPTSILLPIIETYVFKQWGIVQSQAQTWKRPVDVGFVNNLVAFLKVDSNQLDMYSVVLTELGISVFNGDKIEKTFQFEDAVGQYIAVKKKEYESDELVKYLSAMQTGVKTSDESLLALLKKSSIDARMMEGKELEDIQTTKPQIIVDSGFADNLKDALELLRDFSLGLASSRITDVSGSPDMHIIQAISTLDEIDKITNTMSSGLREWYGLHFPELENIVDGINGYAHTVIGGKRSNLTREIFEAAGFTESKIEMILLAASNSRGADISDVNLSIVQSIAKQIIDFDKLRERLHEHIETEMNANAPNLSAILGATVGARILRKAGSLKRVATLPASTIQVLGAEKALFRSLKTGSQPPKHGLLFQHAMVHAAPRWQRGKVARAIAAKAVIAARVDVYGKGLNETLLEKLNIRVDEIGKKYEKPVEREPMPEQKKYARESFRGKGHANRKGGKRASTKSKKRKRFGRR